MDRMDGEEREREEARMLVEKHLKDFFEREEVRSFLMRKGEERGLSLLLNAVVERLFLTASPSPWPIPSLEGYMERLFSRNMRRTPSSVAFQTMYYLKIDPRMKPLLIKVARRVKDRLRKRIKRSSET